jgi:RNA polymerase sigma factor (sigma-70 family)
MSNGFTRTAQQHLRTLFELGAGGSRTDAELLECFLSGRDGIAESAFNVLVERHGAMVLGVCRRVLTDPNDADDAFQVTFIVLARKAATINRRESLGNWLYGVAYRTALQARTRASRRRAKERQVRPMSHANSVDAPGADDWLTILDEELDRLPERYRAPLVLCELEGRSRREVANLLGLPEGTVSSRLARGRGLLRDRLGRRGVAVSVGALIAVLESNSIAAIVPAILATDTLRAAMQIAAGHAATDCLSASAAGLWEGVLKMMLLTKLKVTAAVFATLIVAAAGMSVWAQAPARPEAPAQADRLDALEHKLDRVLDALEGTRQPAGAFRAPLGRFTTQEISAPKGAEPFAAPDKVAAKTPDPAGDAFYVAPARSDSDRLTAVERALNRLERRVGAIEQQLRQSRAWFEQETPKAKKE